MFKCPDSLTLVVNLACTLDSLEGLKIYSLGLTLRASDFIGAAWAPKYFKSFIGKFNMQSGLRNLP